MYNYINYIFARSRHYKTKHITRYYNRLYTTFITENALTHEKYMVWHKFVTNQKPLFFVFFYFDFNLNTWTRLWWRNALNFVYWWTSYSMASMAEQNFCPVVMAPSSGLGVWSRMKQINSHTFRANRKTEAKGESIHLL